MNNNIEYSKVKVGLECMEEALLPDYLGSTLRGVLGIELKKCVCTKDLYEICPNCEEKYSCAYTFFFNHIEQNVNTKNMQTLPNSFVIEPISDNKLIFHKGDCLEFNIIFIGVNIGYMPLFINALEKVADSGLSAQRKNFRLADIEDCSAHKKVYSDGIFNPRNIMVMRCIENLKFNKATELRINFNTPFRFKSQGKITDGLNFELFMRNIFRRTSALSRLYCNREWELDYKAFLEEARNITVKNANLKWHDWERFSSTHKSKIKMGGIVGEIVFGGDITKFLPYIHIGSIVHIGKGCTFGLGKYTYET